MTGHEINNYWLPARKVVWGGEPEGHWYEASQKLAALLGISYPTLNYTADFVLTDKIKHQLELIKGPNGKTVVKILEARQK